MKTKYILTTILSGMTILSACVDDKGSYDYRDLNEVTVEGLQDYSSPYSVMAKTGILDINPTVKGTILGDDESQYEYTWYACQSEIASDNHDHTVLGREKHLHTNVDLNPGVYNLYLLVKDKTTDQEWIIGNMSLSVTTPLTTGFYVFGDNPDGTVGMDFLSMPGNGGGDTAVVNNIFINSPQIRGAENLFYRGYTARPGAIIDLWAVTESGSYRIECSVQEKMTFDIDPTYNEELMFFSDMMARPVKIVDAFPHQVSGGSAFFNPNYRGYITEDAIVGGGFVSGGESYSNPVNRYTAASTELFRPYKTMFYMAEGTSILGYMVYDLDNDRFVTLNGNYMFLTTKYCRQLTDNAGDPFPWNQNGRTIVYGTNAAYYSYAIMKDKDNDTNFYLYEMYVYSYLSPYKASCSAFTTDDAPEFDKASHFAIAYQPADYAIILYAVGNKLYQFNYNTKQAQLVREYDGEITYLAYDWRVPASADNDGTRYLVCTYNKSAADSNERGTIYMYTIDQSLKLSPVMKGPDQSEEFIYHTPLKVVKLEYRNSSL